MEAETMDVKQVVEYTGLDKESIHRMVSTRQIPFVESVTGLRFEKKAIDLWLHLLDDDSVPVYQTIWHGTISPGNFGFDYPIAEGKIGVQGAPISSLFKLPKLDAPELKERVRNFYLDSYHSFENE
ncbi:MAG: DNA-binding protein [Dehalococcoidia bacterium]|nr:MAG: DNA-binding protein [Dehalococcoidia bacterium]